MCEETSSVALVEDLIQAAVLELDETVRVLCKLHSHLLTLLPSRLTPIGKEFTRIQPTRRELGLWNSPN
jgi:hypothetical protein